MMDKETVSWIFLATALAANTKPTDFNGITLVADGINHAVPTQKEMQTSIVWLTNNGLIVKHGNSYSLTKKGKFEYDTASKDSDKLLVIWKDLENNLSHYADN